MILARGKLLSALSDLWPFYPLVFTFILSALLHNSGPFYLVEPVFYALYFLAFGVGGYLVRMEGNAAEFAKGLVVVAFVGCFFYAAMTVTVYLFAVRDNFSRLDDVIPWGFVNIRYWSHIASWLVPLFPLSVLALPLKKNRFWRLSMTFTAAMWWWILFLSSSRGSMIGLLAGVIVVWLCFGRVAVPWVKLCIRFAVYGLIAWFFLSVVIPGLMFDDIHIRGLTGGASGRIPLWQEAWTMSLQHFPLGMGAQSWLTHDILTEAYRTSRKLGHPHNMYLMWAAEYGWISIGGLVLLCGVALRNLLLRALEIRAEQCSKGMYLVAFTGSVAAALVHANVSAVFLAPGSMLVGLLVLIGFWAMLKPDSATASVSISPVQAKLRTSMGLSATTVVLALSAFWVLEVLRYREAMSDDMDFYQAELRQGQLPRFWFHGNFPRHPSEMPLESK